MRDACSDRDRSLVLVGYGGCAVGAWGLGVALEALGGAAGEEVVR